jgi:DNA-binding transcriptional ArsR family regulator
MLTFSSAAVYAELDMAIDKTIRALNRYISLKVLDQLRRGPKSVNNIAADMKIGSRVGVSQALALLLDAELVTRRREGRLHYYQLRASGFKELAGYLRVLVRDAERGLRRSNR